MPYNAMKVLLLLLGMWSFVASADVILKWDTPPDPIATKAHTIYCAVSPDGPWQLQATLPGGTTSSGTVQPCASTGTVYFVARAVNFANVESGNSNVASVRMDALSPPVVQACPVVIVKMTVAPRTGYTDRPLYQDATRSKTIGRVDVGQPCENETLLKTTAGEWRWTTNLAGTRGVSLCK